MIKTPKTQTSVSIDERLLDQVDAFIPRLNADSPGASFSRSAVIARLLTAGMKAVQQELDERAKSRKD